MRGRGLLSVLLLVSTYGAAQNASPAEVEQLQVKREGSEVKIEIMLTGAVQPSIETAINPDRLVLSLPGVISDAKQKRYPLNADGVRGVRMGLNSANPPVTRVVVDLDSALPYTMSADGKSIVLHVQAADTTASKHQGGAVPAASAPLIGMFRRKPPTPPAIDVSAAAPIPVPPKLPPIIYSEKPATAQPVASAPPEKPSAAHPKTGSLQQGTVFPGMGTPGNGAVPHTQAPAGASGAAAPANNGLSIASVTGGGATSTSATSSTPAAVNVSIAPTTAKKDRPIANTVTPYSVAEVITPSTPSTAPATPSVTSPTPIVAAGTAPPSGASDQAPSPNSLISSAALPAPTTSSAGAPNVTSQVVSATVVTPAPTATASTTTPSQVATVAAPASPPPTASPASQAATVASPLPSAT